MPFDPADFVEEVIAQDPYSEYGYPYCGEVEDTDPMRLDESVCALNFED